MGILDTKFLCWSSIIGTEIGIIGTRSQNFQYYSLKNGTRGQNLALEVKSWLLGVKTQVSTWCWQRRFCTSNILSSIISKNIDTRLRLTFSPSASQVRNGETIPVSWQEFLVKGLRDNRSLLFFYRYRAIGHSYYNMFHTHLEPT